MNYEPFHYPSFSQTESLEIKRLKRTEENDQVRPSAGSGGSFILR